MIDFWLPRAKLCCFSANYDSRAGTTRRYDGPRRSNRGSMKFNTFGETVFLRLPRSCRVAEKSDPIDRFSGPDLQKITKNRWFLSNFSTTRHDRAKRRKTNLANVLKARLPNYAGNANTQPSPWHAMLSRVLCHLHPLQCLHGITFDSSHNAAPPPPHPPRLNLHFYCFDIGYREPNCDVF